MTVRTRKKSAYRRAAGIAVFNHRGEVWLGRRRSGGRYAWQMPQGGIDPGEKALQGAVRELHEETGIAPHWLTPLGKIDDWLYYDYPSGKQQTKGGVTYYGQRQKWFAFRFEGMDHEVNLRFHTPYEFTRWRWGKLSDTPDMIIPFKRKVYSRVAEAFAPFTQPTG